MDVNAIDVVAALGSIAMPFVAVLLYVVVRKQASTKESLEGLGQEIKTEVAKLEDRISHLRVVKA